MGREDSNYKIINPLVSIIVISYNSAKFVLETLESVKLQSYSDIELIISDDFSTDDTITICKNWLKEHNSRFVRSELIIAEKNTGIPSNCNRGVKAARGEWVKFIAGDDVLTPNSVKHCIEHINASVGGVHVLHGCAEMYLDNFESKNHVEDICRKKWQFNRPDIHAKDQFNILLRTNHVLAPTVFLRKSTLEKAGLFQEDFILWEDTPMWLKLTNKGIKFHFIPEHLAKYRLHSNSVQKTGDTKYFSRYQLLRDKAYLKVIFPYLPLKEKMLNGYLIQVRKIMNYLGLNKNTILIHKIYRLLTFVVVDKVTIINKQYKG